MVNKIRVFENQEFGKVRTLELNNEPWFVGKDIEYEANKRGGISTSCFVILQNGKNMI